MVSRICGMELARENLLSHARVYVCGSETRARPRIRSTTDIFSAREGGFLSLRSFSLSFLLGGSLSPPMVGKAPVSVSEPFWALRFLLEILRLQVSLSLSLAHRSSTEN